MEKVVIWPKTIFFENNFDMVSKEAEFDAESESTEKVAKSSHKKIVGLRSFVHSIAR
jgi:hypothetical protein